MDPKEINADTLSKMGAMAPQIVPLDGPATRVTTAAIEFDGGSFVLRLFEIREPATPRAQYVSGERQLVEVGRFAVTPLAMRGLDGAVANAKGSYKAVMGQELPDSATLTPALQKFALDQMKASTKK